ncbi:10138_t:CDS:10 [Cetraspora pellucida]|uniref:10138_t:CDS:1 n=1 Tax=Cetraspora pellucida TaxID=1433469 RepID=A0ACA9KG08_9GLOM|nr:10138_t:CDS:10 [Cetraspora pellucida]
MDDQIKVLTQLGVTKEKARDALARFNGDVERAANFIFTDTEETPGLAPLGSDSQNDNWNQGGESVLGYLDRPNDSTSFETEDRDMKTAIEASMADKENEDLKMALEMSEQTTSYPEPKDSYSDSRAVVLYNGNNKNWCDWEQPVKRQKLDTTPLGLKPVIDYYYASSFFQALFHIPIFRLSLLAFRPTKDDWGNVEGYWKGQKHYRSYTNDDNSKLYSSVNRQESLKFIHEVQKLFGFLSLSQRAYGDSSQLMDVLDFDEKAIWNEAEVVSSFTNKLITKLLEGSNYRDRVSGDQDIPTDLQQYILDFEKFKIYPSCLTIYDALDRVMQESKGNLRKPFFTQLAHILIMNLKHKDSDGNVSFPTFQGDSTFQVLKEIYMDRYMYDNSQFVERCWQKIEIMKDELEKINQSIDKIIKFQGKHNGPDLLKGSIEHFQQKCNKAEEKGTTDDDAQQTKTWLEGVLDKVEQKLNALFEKKDELEQNIKQIFDIPDMKKYHYRLKAVLVHNGQSGSGNHWAYIWVSRCSKSDNRISSTMDNGNWMKFQDNCVEEAIENTVLNEPGSYYSSHSVYTLFYVNAQVDYNFPNLEDVIPESLKAFVEKDNQILEEELGNQIRQAELPDNNTMDGTWESDSTACGGSSDSETIQNRVNTINEQAKNLKIYDARILKRIELFFVKLGKSEEIKSLITEYSKSIAGLDWSDPIPLDDNYRHNQRYVEIVKAFNDFKEIAQYIVEGLDQMIKKRDFFNAICYFYKAIQRENSWIGEMTSSIFIVNLEKLRRTSFIISYVKICLKILNDEALEHAKKDELFEQAIKEATFVLRTFIVFDKTCGSDVLFNEFLQEWVQVQAQTDKMHENLISELVSEYCLVIDVTDKDEPNIPFSIVDDIPLDNDDTLFDRYRQLTWKCKEVFNNYSFVPDPQ